MLSNFIHNFFVLDNTIFFINIMKCPAKSKHKASFLTLMLPRMLFFGLGLAPLACIVCISCLKLKKKEKKEKKLLSSLLLLSLNEFDHRILALLKQQRERPERGFKS